MQVIEELGETFSGLIDNLGNNRVDCKPGGLNKVYVFRIEKPLRLNSVHRSNQR